MGLRDFLRERLSNLLPPPRLDSSASTLPSHRAYQSISNITVADEQAFLKQQVMSHLNFLRAFDAEMHESILRLHEPEDGIPVSRQVEQLIELKGRMSTVLAMTSMQIFKRTPIPVVEAKLALELGAASGELGQILGRIGDLHKVLDEMPLNQIIKNHGNETRKAQLREKFCESLSKLVMINIYGKKALLDLYPDERKTIAEIRRDFKNNAHGY